MLGRRVELLQSEWYDNDAAERYDGNGDILSIDPQHDVDKPLQLGKARWNRLRASLLDARDMRVDDNPGTPGKVRVIKIGREIWFECRGTTQCKKVS